MRYIGHNGATWRIRLNHAFVCGGDAALCEITLTTCCYFMTCALDVWRFNELPTCCLLTKVPHARLLQWHGI